MSVEMFPALDMAIITSVELCHTTLATALEKHFEIAAHPPTTLIISPTPGMADKAYRLCGSADFPGNPHLLIVCVPGLRQDCWIVCSPTAMVVCYE